MSATYHFRPWEGALYRSAGLGGVRILVLGESHYEWGSRPVQCPEETELTEFCVREYQRKKKHQFWTRVTNMLIGDGRTDVAIWDRVAYYNFVQTLLDKHQRPTEAMWKDSVEPFQRVVQQLEPHCILALGKSLWAHIPEGIYSSQLITSTGESRPIRWFRISSAKRAPSTFVNHPRSRQFTTTRWRPVVQALLRAANSSAND